jgi:inosose dehydratase
MKAARRLLRVGNAPCSWGSLEFDEAKASEPIGYSQMLDELAETGYTGTELGDWGYMPTDPGRLSEELAKRSLVMLGGFVPVALREAEAHAKGIKVAVRTARLLAAVASEDGPKPLLVLADNNGTVEQRTKYAGRIEDGMGLSLGEWGVFARGANVLARTVLEETGLRTVFHHHCAGFVETPHEIARFLEMTDPALMGLVFDTGHYTYGAGPDADAGAAIERFAERISYVHFKDCHKAVAARARKRGWDYFEALKHGLFCELGKGCVDFPAVLRQLKSIGYGGYILVEQDVLPGLGSPKSSAKRNRRYVKSIEKHFY